MYQLTLTHDERMAIDWIGSRYSNGQDLKSLLCTCEYKGSYTSDSWNSEFTLVFWIPEHIAWEISENASQEDGDLPYNFPCFSQDLTEKLLTFCEQII